MQFCKLFVAAANLGLILGSPTWLGNEHDTESGQVLDIVKREVSQRSSLHMGDAETNDSSNSQVTNTPDKILDVTDDPISGKMLQSPWQFRLPRVFCNFDKDSEFREVAATFKIHQIDASLCTDVNYDHAELEEYHFQSVTRINVLPHERNLFLPRYIAINDLKVINPTLRTFLTLAESRTITFNSIVLDVDRKRDFVTSCAYNLRLWGFDGLMVKWIYPSQPEYLTQLLVHLRNAFLIDFQKQKKGVSRLLLGVILTGETGAASDWYEVYAISKLVDVIILQLFDVTQLISHNATSIMTYLYTPTDVNGDNETNTNNNITTMSASNFLEPIATFSALQRDPLTPNINRYYNNPAVGAQSKVRWWPAGGESNTNNADESGEELQIDSLISQLAGSLSNSNLFVIDDTVNEWTTLGADKSKLVIGLSLTGQVYYLMDKTKNGIGAPIKVPHHDDTGQVFFYEMCNMTKRGTVRRVSANDKTPYWYNDSLWVSYEDLTSIAQKVEYLRDNHLLGVMLFSLSEDDFSGTYCGQGAFPVSRTVENVSRVYLSALSPFGTNEWAVYCGVASNVDRTTVWRLFLVMCIKYLV